MSLIKDPNEEQGIHFVLRRNGTTHLEGPTDNPILMWGLIGALLETWLAERMSRAITQEMVGRSPIVTPGGGNGDAPGVALEP